MENYSERDVGHRQRCIVLGMEQWFEINNVNGACASGQGAFIVNGAFVGAEFGDWGLRIWGLRTEDLDSTTTVHAAWRAETAAWDDPGPGESTATVHLD